jgi:hypothetical protein
MLTLHTRLSFSTVRYRVMEYQDEILTVLVDVICSSHCSEFDNPRCDWATACRSHPSQSILPVVTTSTICDQCPIPAFVSLYFPGFLP